MQQDNIFNLDYINPKIMLRVVIKNFWVIILAAVSVFMITTAVGEMLYKPQYVSSATFAINAKNTASTNSLQVTKQLAQVFGDIFQSDVLKNLIKDDLEIDRLSDTISTEVIPETNLMKVNVTSSSPESAYRTMNSAVANYRNVSDYVYRDAIFEMLKAPNVPVEPDSSGISLKNRLLITLLVAVAAAAAIVIIYIFGDTIQTIAAARDKIDGEMFSVIPHEEKYAASKNQKTSILIGNPLTSFQFTESYHSLSAKLDYRLKKNAYKVILVSSAAENEGKSTVSANLALALADRQRKVLLVGCDFKKPAVRKIFDLPKEEIEDLCSYIEDGDLTEEYHFSQAKNIYIADSQTGIHSTQKIIYSDALVKFIEIQKSKFDYIILDTPPMLLTSDAEALSKVADASLLVVKQDYITAGGINDCIDRLNVNSNSFMGYVINNFEQFGKQENISVTHGHSNHSSHRHRS